MSNVSMQALANNTAHHVKGLATALKGDPDFFMSYQANIAMAIYDRLQQRKSTKGAALSRKEQKEACNAGAKDFLNLLIGKDETK